MPPKGRKRKVAEIDAETEQEQGNKYETQNGVNGGENGQPRRSGRQRKSLIQTLNEKRLSQANGKHQQDSDEADDDFEQPPPPPTKRKRATNGTSKPIPASTSTSDNADDDFGQIMEEEKDLSTLFVTLAHTSSAVKLIVHTWWNQFKTNRQRNAAYTELINFLLHACGSHYTATSEEAMDALDEDRANVVQQASSPEVIFANEPPIKRYRKFGSRLGEFFMKLTATLPTSILFGETGLIPDIMSWCAAIASSPVRPFRYTMTQASISIMNGIIALCKSLSEKWEKVETQLNALNSSSRSNRKVVEQLTSQIEDLDKELASAEEAAENGFKVIFVHRYRDVDPTIRALCMEGFGQWMVSYPKLFLSDAYLKYIGWTLHDKAPGVRKTSLMAILEVYRVADTEMVEKLTLFTRRFYPRFSEMCSDIDSHVSTQAIHVMTALLKCGMLEENQGDQVPPLIWGNHSDVRTAALQFLFEDTFADSENSTDPRSTEQNMEDLIQLLNVFDKYCPLRVSATSDCTNQTLSEGDDNDEEKEDSESIGANNSGRSVVIQNNLVGNIRSNNWQYPMDVLVDGMFKRLTVLKDWSCMTSLLLASEQSEKSLTGNSTTASKFIDTMDPVRQQILMHMMLSTAKKALGKLNLDNRSTKIDKKLTSELEQGLITHFLDVLPRLMTVFGSDAAKTNLLLQMLRLIPLDSFATYRKKSVFVEFCRILQGLYLKHTESSVIEECGLTFHYLSSENAYADLAKSSVHELSTKLSGFVESIEEEALPVEMEDPDQLIQILVTVRRILYLYRPLQLSEISWSSASKYAILLDHFLAAPSSDSHNQIVSVLLQLQSAHLTWGLLKLTNVENIDSATLTNLTTNRDVALTALETILGRSKSVFLRDEAFRILSDMFVLFTGRLANTKLHSLAISSNRLPSLQRVYNEYFTSIIRGDDIECRCATGEVSDVILDDIRVFAFLCAARTISHDHLSNPTPNAVLRHPRLCALLFVNYNQFGSECDAVIRACMTQLRTISNNTLLAAQLVTLKHSYEHHTHSEEDLRILASRFVLLFPMNPNSRSFLAFLKSAISYATSDPPARLSFFDIVIPFVQRASSKDLSSCTSFFTDARRAAFETEAAGSQSPEEWAPIKRFAAALRKKADKSTKDVTLVDMPSRASTPVGGDLDLTMTSLRTPLSSRSMHGRESMLNFPLSPISEIMTSSSSALSDSSRSSRANERNKQKIASKPTRRTRANPDFAE